MEMEKFLNKKYKFDRTDEHFEEYLAAIGDSYEFAYSDF